MTHEKIKRFENKTRLEELSPKETLRRSGFKEGMTLCDIGAGTGAFSIPATEMSRENIYALEISDDMIDLLEKRIAEKNIKNLKVKKVKNDSLPLEDKSCNMVIMVTSLHHIDDKDFMADEIKRVLKKEGRLMIVEFHKRETPMGPPAYHRISQEEVESFGKDNGFKQVDKFILGENFYVFIFEVAN